jgi:endonuclease/exonuclease/phosphatase family metal-dependent hydrolase
MTAHHGPASTLRVATWNVECITNPERVARQLRRMQLFAADIWVLTETLVDRLPGPGFEGVFCPPGTKPEQHRKVGIWSHWPIRLMDTPPGVWRGSATAIIDTPFGEVVVYGSVIAYHGDRQHLDGRSAKNWEVHASEIERQSIECAALVAEGRPLVVAGDCNQARDPLSTRGYGTNAVRAQLTAALDAANLNPLTDLDLFDRGDISQRPHVDHICVSDHFRQVGDVLAADRLDTSGSELYDHVTIAVDLALALE